MLAIAAYQSGLRLTRHDLMTFRVYVRWPGQRVSDKTKTESRAVADLAFRELEANARQLASQGALGISLTEDGKQVEYRRLGGDGSSEAEAVRREI